MLNSSHLQHQRFHQLYYATKLSQQVCHTIIASVKYDIRSIIKYKVPSLLLVCNKARDEIDVHSTTLCLKNTPTLTSCSFDKHGLILIIFGKQHQHTFRNDMHIQLLLSLHFYSFYLLFNSCDRKDAK